VNVPQTEHCSMHDVQWPNKKYCTSFQKYSIGIQNIGRTLSISTLFSQPPTIQVNAFKPAKTQSIVTEGTSNVAEIVYKASIILWNCMSLVVVW
jgi:hypothetical protein